MKIAVGALLFEGNTFAVGQTTLEDFSNNYLVEGQSVLDELGNGEVEVSGAIGVLRAANAEIVPMIATHGGAGGRVTRECVVELSRRMLGHLGDTKVDGVFLALHGAMVAEGNADYELDLISEIRKRVGKAPIVITLDLHAHITPRMLELCDGIVGYQHYPHDDAFETGIRGAKLLLAAVSGDAQLTTSMKKLSLLVSPTTAGTRLRTPMRELFKKARAMEGLPGILAVSYFPSTPWAERADGGTAFVVVTDGDTEVAKDLLDGLCETAWSRRADFQPILQTPDEALELAAGVEESPVILSEMSDAVGAGASGDSAYMLAYFLKRQIADRILLQIVDPVTVEQAEKAGIGKTIHCDLGNKIENRFGPPVSIAAEVVALCDGAFTYRGGLMSGVTSTTGRSAVLRSKNVTILITSRSAYEYADEQYAAAGLNVRDFRYVVVKNPMNYRQAYAWAPATFALDTPGAGRSNLRELPWRHCVRPFYPMDDSAEPLYR